MQTVERIRLYLVSDNRLVRESAKRLLERASDVEVVGTAPNPDLALRDLGRLAVEILLLQCSLSETSGPCPVHRIKTRFPRIKVLMFGMPEEEEEFFTAMRFGACGYLLKEASVEEIIEGVKALARNEAVIPRSLSLALVEYVAGIRTYPLRTERGPASLTQRERQLLPLIGRGFTNKEIAERLGISEQTVKNHVRSILSKLNAKSRRSIGLEASSGPFASPVHFL